MSANTTLSAPRSSARDKERRRSERVPHVMEAWVVSPTARNAVERLAVQSMNLSRHGVAFTLERSLPTGAYYVIEIGVGAQRLLSEVRIVSCRRVGEAYEIGSEFH